MVTAFFTYNHDGLKRDNIRATWNVWAAEFAISVSDSNKTYHCDLFVCEGRGGGSEMGQ